MIWFHDYYLFQFDTMGDVLFICFNLLKLDSLTYDIHDFHRVDELKVLTEEELADKAFQVAFRLCC